MRSRRPGTGADHRPVRPQSDCCHHGCGRECGPHLAHQLHTLRDIDPLAVAAIASIVEEEQHHHDHSAAQIERDDPWFRTLAPVVTAWTEAVIWMGMRS